MRILVTGREGQLARSLAEAARDHPDLDLDFAARPGLDLALPGSFAAIVRDQRPDVIVNAAAYTAVDQAESEPALARRVNAQAAGEGAEAAAVIGARFVQISTDYVYAGTGDAPLREDEPVAPRNVYGATKLAGEDAVRAANPAHLILRAAWVVSPFGRNFVRTMLNAAATRDELSVVDDQRGSPTSAPDLAAAIVTVLEQWRGGSDAGLGHTLHAAGAGATSWCGLAAQVMDEARACGLPAAHIRPIATADWPTPAARPMWSVLDSSRLHDIFGVAMPDWRPSIASIVRRLATENQ